MTKFWTRPSSKHLQITNVTEMIFFSLDRVENIMGKEDNAGYWHFLLFPQCFRKESSSTLLKVKLVWKRVSFLTNESLALNMLIQFDKILNLIVKSKLLLFKLFCGKSIFLSDCRSEIRLHILCNLFVIHSACKRPLAAFGLKPFSLVFRGDLP